MGNNHFVVLPSKLYGDIEPPPSKSHSIRAILFASMSNGTSNIQGILQSDDTMAMIKSCRKLGAIIEENGDNLLIIGNGSKPQAPNDVIWVANSGQVLRFMTAIFALQAEPVVLTGDHSVQRRPMQDLLDGLKQLGVPYDEEEQARAPVKINGPIKPGTVLIKGQDSQFVSALLMSLPYASGNSTILVSNPKEKPWIDFTCSWLDKMNIKYEREGYSKFYIYGNTKTQGFNFKVPKDFSSMAYPLVGAIITNSTVIIKKLDFYEQQGDQVILDICKKMGARIQVDKAKGCVTIYPESKLTGIEIDADQCIDAVPILAVLGCFAKGITKLINIEVAKTKESDRLAVITGELRKMGANILEKDNELIINQSDLKGCRVKSHGDHRIALALAIAGLNAKGETIISGVDCVDKSYPMFAHSMSTLSGKVSKR